MPNTPLPTGLYQLPTTSPVITALPINTPNPPPNSWGLVLATWDTEFKAYAFANAVSQLPALLALARSVAAQTPATAAANQQSAQQLINALDNKTQVDWEDWQGV